MKDNFAGVFNTVDDCTLSLELATNLLQVLEELLTDGIMGLDTKQPWTTEVFVRRSPMLQAVLLSVHGQLLDVHKTLSDAVDKGMAILRRNREKGAV